MDAKGSSSGVGKAGDNSVTKGSGGEGMMKAPGGGGANISRNAFESNPKGYFSDLYGRKDPQQEGLMKAPGGGGAYISRDAFEGNPKGYFSNLHENQKGK